MSNENSISLNKYISSTGLCSRREADKMIDAGRVLLNGAMAVKGNRFSPGDSVTLDGRPVGQKENNLILLLNKPPGITCTTDLKDPSNIIDFMNYPERIFPIGRLDKPSTGLILLTNDGDIVNKILRSEFEHEKEYIVTVDRLITAEFISKMSNGLPILDQMTKKCRVEQLGPKTFNIVLTQGLNRQIRRMCEYLNYDVLTLKRVRIMNIKLSGLARGDWREITDGERKALLSAIGE